MKPLNLEQTLALADYERVREVLRPLFIDEKDRRRLTVGDHLTVLFENTRTVWYQVHEMIRSERMTTREAIQHELATYNELIPRSGELSATVLIQYTDAAHRDIELRKLIGFERHLWIVAGDRRELAHFDPGRWTPRASARFSSSASRSACAPRWLRSRAPASSRSKVIILSYPGAVWFQRLWRAPCLKTSSSIAVDPKGALRRSLWARRAAKRRVDRAVWSDLRGRWGCSSWNLKSAA